MDNVERTKPAGAASSSTGVDAVTLEIVRGKLLPLEMRWG
jgi:hypothetical protein